MVSWFLQIFHRERSAAAVPLICLVLLPMPAAAEPVQIPGPQGHFEAEMIAVEGANHALVIIPGSGPTDRDGNSPSMGLMSDSYKMLAEDLARLGVASLRIDKRGFFGSASALSDPNDVTIKAYAEDARRWVEKASELAPCVWLAGHSEGGLVALVAAMEPPEALCGLVLMAAPGRPIGQLMIEQFEASPGAAPLLPQLRSVVADLEAGRHRDPEQLTPNLRPLFSTGLQRYMIDLFSHDPADIAGNWEGPALIVQGDADIQVRMVDADLLQTALPQAQQLVLSGATHMLKADVAGQPAATYTDPTLPLHEDLVPGIVRFLDGVAKP
ncbi:alpha/beta fold hydrolase [uncultured Roseibium sp.]|uniref:alpha/beta hydrolase n=1 Tax=uncultured Roseibium sp. TaxID=1936171 RepID=UPI002631A27A|nr:alpha/beta fold hydrolase [uncultured Roseibium sp.]